jgi:hypothetical protein
MRYCSKYIEVYLNYLKYQWSLGFRISIDVEPLCKSISIVLDLGPINLDIFIPLGKQK